MFREKTNQAKLLLFGILTMGLNSCHLEEQTIPVNEVTILTSPPKLIYGEIKVNNNPNARESAVKAAAPVITKVVSSTSCDNCTNTSQVIIPWIGQQNRISILGSNFTNSGTSIKITDALGKIQNNYAFAFLTWKDNEILLQTGASLYATPLSLKIEIERGDGAKSNIIINVSPVISGKIFNSEPYAINKKLIEMKLQPLPNGLYIQGPLLNADWIPKVGNVWLFDSPTKQSLVTFVSMRIVPISSNKAGAVDDIYYEVGTFEWVNNKDANMSRQIVIRRTTTIFTNGTKKYFFALRTPAGSAFNSITKGLIAKRYYN